MKILQDLVPGCNKVNNNNNLLYRYQIIASIFLHVIFFTVQVIGKALVLDEIINYIQSLQRQVEVDIFIFLSLLSIEHTNSNLILWIFFWQFLSMKLEAVNSRLNMNPAVECFPSKEVSLSRLKC